MIKRIVIAFVIAIAVGLVLVKLLGPLFVGMNVPPATAVGNFSVTYGWVIVVLFGIWFYFTGGTFSRSQKP